MHPNAHVTMASIEQTHWWFVARRMILRSELGALSIPPAARVLEIGAGTGGNLQMLSSFGKVCAVETSGVAREIARKRFRGACEILAGSLPDHMPFASDRFDIICMFDVLEHIENDVGALRKVRTLMSDGGRVILTVPAYPWLWSYHDEHLDHFRRYTKKVLTRTATDAGLRITRLTHFNGILFPVVASIRLLGHLQIKFNNQEDRVPPALINYALTAIFGLERYLLRVITIPFGLSLLAVLETS